MGINVQFIDPSAYGMNRLPPAIARGSALLNGRGRNVEIFDIARYGIDADGTKMVYLKILPCDMGNRGIRLRAGDWRQDAPAQAGRFKPDPNAAALEYGAA